VTVNLDSLEGLITASVGEFLRLHAGRVADGYAIVELGSYKGKSTAYLAAGASDGVQVYAVDAWDLPGNQAGWGALRFTDCATREAFRQQLMLSGARDKVTVIQEFTAAAGREWSGPPVGMLYVDADHSYDSVCADFAAWAPHLTPGALVVFDDYGGRNKGVTQAVNELVSADELEFLRLACGRLAVCAR